MLRIRKKREAEEPRNENVNTPAEQIEAAGVIVEEAMPEESPDELHPEPDLEETENEIDEEIGESEKLPTSESSDEIGENDVLSDSFVSRAEAYAKGKGLAESQLNEALGILAEIKGDPEAGEVSMEILDLIVRGLDYDRAVAAASAEGELRGRNTQIEEKYMRPAQSDGVPHLGSGGRAVRSADRIASIFDLARNA